MEAPEGFRNSDEDHFSESQVNVRIWSPSVGGFNLKRWNKQVSLFLCFSLIGVECGGRAGFKRSRNAGGAGGAG